MAYTQMLFALAFDKLVFGVTPEFLSLTGSTLILGSAIYVAVQKENAKSIESVQLAQRQDEEQALVQDMDGAGDDVDDANNTEDVEDDVMNEEPLRQVAFMLRAHPK